MTHKNTQFLKYKSVVLSICGALLIGSLTGCAVAAIGAGAGGGIAFTERGARGDVKGKIEHVNEQAKAVLQEMNIQLTGNSMKDSGKEETLSGRTGGTEISVDMSQSTLDMTHIEVIVKEGTLKWNKDYAQKVLSKIVNRL